MKKYKDILIGSILGLIVFGIIGVVAANITASTVSFNNSHAGFSSTTLDGAIDELYDLVNDVIDSDKSNKVFSNGEIVYYNPVTGRGCTESDWNPSNVAESSVSQSSTGTKTGCMRWFAYLDSAGQDKVKLLLDHNTTVTKKWYDSSSYVLLPQSNVYADLVALVKTSGWKVQPTLIDANDVASITGISWTSTGTSVSFRSGSTYWWLNDRTYECTSHGCQTADSSNDGYWTSTNKGTGSSVWTIQHRAYLDYFVATYTGIGVRPVVEVYKANL